MGHIALYRQFRPDNFDDVIGQDALIETLRGQVMNGRVNHAYLFCGPRGIGKTSVARILAKAINCQNPQNGNYCGKCDACIALNNQSNFDIIEIDAASNNGVDNIRDLRENIKFMPAAGKYRVYIIDEVHMLSISAFNALLKTLEEPPAHIVFIMATTEPGKLPITVLSRCQRFDFNRVKSSDIVKVLENVAEQADIKIQKNAIESIARASEGGVRDALSLLDQCNAFTQDNITAEHVASILGSANRLMYFALADSIITENTPRALAGFNKMLDDGCNTLSVARDLMGHFRDLFIAKHVKDVANTLSVDDVMASRLTSQASKASEGVLIRCIELFSTLESDLRYASHPRIFVELAIAKACRSEKENSYDNILERIEKIENAIKNGEIAISKNADDIKENKKKDEIEIELQEYASVDDAEEYPGFAEPPSEDVQSEYFPYEDKEPKQKQPEKPKRTLLEEVQEKTEMKSQKQEKKADKPKSGSKRDAVDAWNKAIELIKKQKKMGVVTAMRKAVPKDLDDEALIVMYDANLTGLSRLEEQDSKRIVNEALTAVLGRTMKIEIEHKVLDEEDINFLEDVSKFPKDLINKK